MVYIKNWILIFCLCFFYEKAKAFWNPMIAHAGFLGQFNAGGIFHFDDNHSVELNMGSYEMDRRNFIQINFGYAYSPWLLQVPDRYVARNYYKQNGLHLALHFGAAVKYKENLRFILFTMILDDALVIMYNNPGERIDQTFISTGIILEWML